MELLIADRTYADWEGSREKYVSLLKRELSALGKGFELGDADIGPGADWPMFLATFGAIFFLGNKINENLDAWVSIGCKFHRILTNLRQHFGAIRVDEVGASLLAIQQISEQHPKIDSLVRIAESTIAISPLSGRDPHRLDSRVDALYVQAFEVNREMIYVIGVKSGGTVDFVHKYGSNYMTFEEAG